MENENYTGVIPKMDANDDGAAAVKLTGLRKQDDEDHQDSNVDTENEEAAASKVPLTEDGTKVKFSKSGSADRGLDGEENAAFNGEAKVAIESIERVPFAGMGKDELLKYVNDPFWVRMRWFFFILFWLLWLAMLAGAIGIVVLAPKCAPLPKRDWWQKSSHYQVVVQSFKDSNSDGIGDLPGLASKLPYLVDTGIGAIWLNSIYKSPQQGFSYEVSNHTVINPVLGTMEDFDALVKALKESGIKLILDFVPNHTSKQHEWFERSRNRTDPYTDYYIWADGKGPNTPPNNWLSVYGNLAWTYDETRKQYYYHSYNDEEPDLNLRSQFVRKDLEEILKFWIGKGVDGFYIREVGNLFEDTSLIDEPLINTTELRYPYDKYDHLYTTNQPETVPLLLEWRQVLDDFEAVDQHHRILITDTTDKTALNAVVGNVTTQLIDLPLHYQQGYPDNGIKLYDEVKGYLDSIPSYGWPNWLIGSKQSTMVDIGADPNLLDGLQMLTMLIGGSTVTYYGQEIGLSGQTLASHQGHTGNYYYSQQVALMQWSDSANAGFSNATTTWLPLSPNHTVDTVEGQEGNPRSHLGIYKKLTKLRADPAIVYGDVSFPYKTNETFAFARAKKGSPGYVVILNLSPHTAAVDVVANCCDSFSFPESGQVVVRSGNADPSAKNSGKIYFAGLTLGPYESIVITFIPEFKQE